MTLLHPAASRLRDRWIPGLLAVTLGACGGSTDPGPAAVDCDGVTVSTLPVGGHAILDPAATNGCLRLPAAGAGGAEHLVVAYSANGQEAPSGVRGGFSLRGVGDDFAALRAESAPSPRLSAFRTPAGPAAFHLRLRERERQLARSPAAALARLAPARVAVPPTVGSQRDFRVCADTDCAGFVTVRATASYVGSKSAIYLDDTVPAGGFTGSEIAAVGALFDSELYPIDTTAFGRESDVDGNGVVAVLLTDAVNALSPDCQQTGAVIVGYFFGLDLLIGEPNSNEGEVFYGFVPDPTKPVCASKSQVLDLIAPTFIHEFQHMISYHRHVLLGGGEAEETWLNEGLSHFAEELGGRQVTPGSCTGGNCLNQFASGNLLNAYDYLAAPETHYLVEPGSSSGTFAERGANWLFLRWLADRSPADSVLGTDLTRAMLGADAGGLALTGGANVAAAAQQFQAGVTLGTLLGQWHLANYTEVLPGFLEPSGRIRYRTWDLASAFNQVIPGPYPLFPDSTAGPGYRASGTLRGGSGSYARIVQAADAPAVALGLSVKNQATVLPRYAVLRIR